LNIRVSVHNQNETKVSGERTTATACVASTMIPKFLQIDDEVCDLYVSSFL